MGPAFAGTTSHVLHLAFVSHAVMAGLVPAIHTFSCCSIAETWMAGINPAMTECEMELD